MHSVTMAHCCEALRVDDSQLALSTLVMLGMSRSAIVM